MRKFIQITEALNPKHTRNVIPDIGDLVISVTSEHKLPYFCIGWRKRADPSLPPFPYRVYYRQSEDAPNISTIPCVREEAEFVMLRGGFIEPVENIQMLGINSKPEFANRERAHQASLISEYEDWANQVINEALNVDHAIASPKIMADLYWTGFDDDEEDIDDEWMEHCDIYEFDCTSWFVNATDEEILDVIRGGVTDQIAEDCMFEDEEVRDIVKHAAKWACSVDIEPVVKWVRHKRPNIFKGTLWDAHLRGVTYLDEALKTKHIGPQVPEIGMHVTVGNYRSTFVVGWYKLAPPLDPDHPPHQKLLSEIAHTISNHEVYIPCVKDEADAVLTNGDFCYLLNEISITDKLETDPNFVAWMRAKHDQLIDKTTYLLSK